MTIFAVRKPTRSIKKGPFRKRALWWMTSLAMLLFGLAFFVPVSYVAARDVQDVILQLDWSPNTNYTGIYVALENDWYAEEGIALTVIAPGGDTNVEAVVAAGRAQFGIGAQEFMTSARTQGIPIISIGAIQRQNTSGFASINRGIETAADLAGKRYAGYGMPIEYQVLDAVMSSEGANVDEVEFVLIPFGIDLVTLLQRDIHFSWIFYGWQGIEAELRGIELDTVMLNDYFDVVPNYYTPIIITSEKLAADDPELVHAFMKATSKGYTFAAENPDEAAEIFIKHVPEADPELVRRSQRWLSPNYIGDAPRFGEQDERVWQDLADWMLKNELIDSPLNASEAFTNEFLPAP